MSSFMRSWYTSWLPSLPSLNFTLPSSLQGKFISFVLKRLLGNLLRPGQLDSRQIDSQIGSGFVQINDLELDNEAINALLSDLPIVLHDGYISSVTARVPWPNPLTSTLGFSINSLHLTFHLLPSSVYEPPHQSNIAQSMASVADSFIHEELASQDQATLWDSFRADISPPDHSGDNPTVPGGLSDDPFLFNPEEASNNDIDPVGVSMFATLIEGLLARFQFDAVNTKLTLVHPGNMSITISVDKIHYFTNNHDATLKHPSDISPPTGQQRTLSVTGLTFRGRNLNTETIASGARTPTAQTPSFFLRPQYHPPTSPPPLSSSSSSSSLDEETQIEMSQSLAFLPPRNGSPTSTLSSSLYQSAMSTTPVNLGDGNYHHSQRDSSSTSMPPPENINASKVQGEAASELFMSFGEFPVVAQVNTSSTSRPTTAVSGSSYTTPSTHQYSKTDEKIYFSLSFGVIACVFRPWHIRGLSSLIEDLKPTLHGGAETQTDSGWQLGINVEAAAKFRGLIVIIPLTPCDLPASFFESPLIPPLLTSACFRLHLEAISMSLLFVSVEDPPGRRPIELTKPTTITDPLVFGITLGDISLFYLQGTPNTTITLNHPPIASPIVITDYGLTSQYPRDHFHPSRGTTNPSLPTFEAVDWTADRLKTNGLKLTSWRTRPRNPAQEDHVHNFKPSSSAVAVNFKQHLKPSLHRRTGKLPLYGIEVTVVPLHIFVDMEIVLQSETLAFLDEAFGDETSDGATQVRTARNYTLEVETPFASPRVLAAGQKNKERRRLEELAIEDLNLDLDYGIEPTVKETVPENQRSLQNRVGPWPNVELSVKFAMIRVQVRCPSPQLRRPQRSGVLVADLHAIKLFTTPRPTRTSARFKMPELTEQAQVTQSNSEAFILGADCGRVIVACSPAEDALAISILSVGPLVSSSNTEEPLTLPLLPQLAITKSTPSEDPAVLAVHLELPSIILDVSKSTFDSLQYWADDMTQHIQGITNGTFIRGDGHMDTKRSGSRDTSLIGSRFFTKSKSGSGSAMSISTGSSSPRTVIKATISETFVRAMVPRAKYQQDGRPFIAHASDINVSIQAGLEGKSETILTLEVMDLSVDDAEAPSVVHTLISLASPRSLVMPLKPMVKLRISSSVISGTTAKESRVRLRASGFVLNIFPDLTWTSDLLAFAKSPPGAFESVIPSERTRVSLEVNDAAILAYAPNHPGAIVSQIENLEFATDVVGESPDLSFRLSAPALVILAIDDSSGEVNKNMSHSHRGVDLWVNAGFALIAEISDLSMSFSHNAEPPATSVLMDRIRLRVHICADSLSAITGFVSDLTAVSGSPEEKRGDARSHITPTVVSKKSTAHAGLMASVDDLAFRRIPEIGPAPDMISDDLPTNMDYLDESFGAAAGLRELRDDDLDEFHIDESAGEQAYISTIGEAGVVSRFGGETIKIFHHEGIQVKENYFNDLPPDNTSSADRLGETMFQLRIHNGDITLLLYDGFDWSKTRRTIEEEVKEMRRRLARIRQLVANGQVQDPSTEETSTLLFNSLYIGLDQDVDNLEPSAIIAAIDEELRDDMETASQSSWQSLKPPTSGKPQIRSVRMHGKRLTRSRGPSMELCFSGLEAEVDHYLPQASLVSRSLATVRDVEILDHIKTSTWKKFLTDLRSDSRGNIRETDSNMVRIELRSVRPVPDHPVEEARLRAKILPLRLYVDQDAVDFLKRFFSFKDPNAEQAVGSNDNETYFQLAEVFPVDLKLDYKPRRVDYRALREGRTIELMNFFHFDGAEMTLRHITLAGVTGWPRFFELLNDLWTPDVKATQLVDVISGVSPIRSVVNVGSGVADLVLLPIAQYKKDGRIVRGVQKGTTAFVKSTAVEAIKLGARLATGTQVILEQAEGVLGGQFNHPITAEPILGSMGDDFTHLAANEDEDSAETISKYAQQPMNIKEGVQSAYQSLRKNFNSAAQTILAVPMEVYERSGDEGPVRSVIRAVPIAVLKPMIGASEAVSKTLLGLHNTLDPDIRHENEAKYKRP